MRYMYSINHFQLQQWSWRWSILLDHAFLHLLITVVVRRSCSKMQRYL